jgi:hypothetical protein
MKIKGKMREKKENYDLIGNVFGTLQNIFLVIKVMYFVLKYNKT